MTSGVRFTVVAALFTAATFLAGCSASFSPGPVETEAGTLTGRVHGGQQPIVGSHVHVMQASTSAYGGPGLAASTSNASTSLLTGTSYTDSVGGYVLTDSNGFFTITSHYTCTAGDAVYLYALGGNGGGGTNSNIGLMALLGTCPAAGNFAATVPYIWVNEVTTVAAAYALSGFATDATHVGNSGSALSMTGLQNAASTAGNLVNVANGTALATTPNGNGTVPQTELNTLANILAACVNATDAAFANCTTLFGAATGTTNATTPTDTATAAINIAHAPNVNVTTLYGLQAGVAVPFLPDLSAQPNDFTVCLIFTGGGMIKPTYEDTPNTLAIDASGNIWNSNYSTTASVLSEFSPLGVPANSTGFAVGNGAFSVTVDTAGNVWTANYSAATLSEVTPSGTFGGTPTITTVTPANLAGPLDIAFDGSGNMFIAESGNTVLKATSAGVYTAKTTSGQEGLDFPYSVALEPGTAGGVWAANGGSKYVTFLTNALASTSEFTMPSSHDDAAGVAVDANGNAWVGAVPTSSVSGVLEKVTTANVGTAYTPGSHNVYIADYDGVTVDGGNNIWATDEDNGAVYEVNGTTFATMSGTYGFVATGNTPCTAACTTLTNEPQSIAVDGSGNVWYDMVTDATVRELVGLGTPTITPLAAAVANSTIGQRP